MNTPHTTTVASGRKYIAYQTVACKGWDGEGFNVRPVHMEKAKLLTEVQALAVRYTYDNVDLIPVDLEPTTEEVAASDAFFLQIMGQGATE